MSKKDKWVAALRSGDYEKCREVLRTDCEFCAIGVFVELNAPKSWCKLNGIWYNQEYEDSDMLSERASFFVGSMNDAGYSFEYIADFIETHLDENLEVIGEKA